MPDNAELKKLLGLQSFKEEPITFGEFLFKLKVTPEIADSAAATLVRAIHERGEVDIECVPAARRPYLQMLKRMNVPSYVAFDHVKGSQRTVARIMDHLVNAAANGYQLRQALILKGGPASGKSYLVEAFKDALEGQMVFSIDGCPVHENPINLLTLLSPEAVVAISQQLDMADNTDGKPSLKDLVAVAGKPCQHCWNKVFMQGDTSKPNLSEVRVTGERLSSRSFGVATWNPDENLPQALKRGSRGLVDMPEMFDGTSTQTTGPGGLKTSSGSAAKLSVLLDATNDRRFAANAGGKSLAPASDATSDSAEETGGYYPLDAILIGQTNNDAYDLFCKNVPDSDKYTRRMKVLEVPYIMSVTEEELAYKEFISGMRKQPHFDPEALKLAALFAVISRMTKEHEVGIVPRARMYDGEELVIQKKGTGVNIWVEPSTATRAGTASNSPSVGQVKQPDKVEAQHWSVRQFLDMAEEEEGYKGLNMAQQLEAVSQVTENALQEGGHNCVSAIEMIYFLRKKVAQWKLDPGLKKEHREVLDNCSEFIKPTKIGEQPSVIEAEYRRVLIRQLLQVMAPDFDERATALFEKYRLHAGAYARGDAFAIEKKISKEGRESKHKSPVDTDLLDDLDKHMGFQTKDEGDFFRRGIEAEIGDRILKHNRQAGPDETGECVIDWRTLPKLKEGISKKLNEEINKRIERILPLEFQLDEEDKKSRREALARFEQLGYCTHCRDTALNYFIDYRLWKQS